MNNIYSCRKIEKLFTVTSIISGWPDMRNGFHYHQPFPQRVKKEINEVFTQTVVLLFPRLHQPDVEYIDGTKIESKPTSTLSSGEKTLSGTVNA
jgi:hypothetical protein